MFFCSARTQGQNPKSWFRDRISTPKKTFGVSSPLWVSPYGLDPQRWLDPESFFFGILTLVSSLAEDPDFPIWGPMVTPNRSSLCSLFVHFSDLGSMVTPNQIWGHLGPQKFWKYKKSGKFPCNTSSWISFLGMFLLQYKSISFFFAKTR